MAKIDPYTEATNRVLQALEDGIVPWRKPWKYHGKESLILSGQTGKPYRGINVWLLEIAAVTGNHTSRVWYTFNQCKARAERAAERDPSLLENGKAPYWGPRKDEKGTTVYLWKMVKAKGNDDEEDGKVFPLMRAFTVFNGDQLVMPAEYQDEEPAEETDPYGDFFEPIEALEAIADRMPARPTVRHADQGRAYYLPATDTVCLPLREQFENPTRYYSTLVHELAHATGHASRLNRSSVVNSDGFGKEAYSKEELIAEMAACMVLVTAGTTPDYEQSASYIAGWKKALKDDGRLLVGAAQNAQKAADWILDRRKPAED